MSRQVVFGAGQVGRPLAERLVELGHEVVVVTRSGRHVPGARAIAGDVRSAEFTVAAAAGAATVYFCLNASSYRTWARDFPPLQANVLAAAQATRARLVVLENLYAYGPSASQPLRESTPFAPDSVKATTRAVMAEDLLAAHKRGDVQVAIGRAADLFGPGVTDSALGERVFTAALRGRRAQTLGDPDTRHSYSYARDDGQNLAVLGTHADAPGHAWHLPNPPVRTTREVINAIFAVTGRTPRLLIARRPMLRAIGLVMPDVRELLATYYQFAAPFVVDDSAFRAAFGGDITDWDTAIAATLEHCRLPATQTG